MKTCTLVAAVALVACAQTQPQPQPESMAGQAATPTFAEAPDMVVILTGDLASPPVSTAATGRALILVNDDGTIAGVIEAPPGMVGSSAAIEDDDADADGTLVVMLVPAGDGRWQVPAGTRLTPKQNAHYKSGKLYANVRSKAHPKGEMRAQLQQGKSRTKAMDSAASGPAGK